ncbi:MAG: monooxygenase family protein [Solirubrobacteraceae bacterium]
MKIRTERWAATHDHELVVFLIGMRINRPWKVRQWWPVFTAMPRMLKWIFGNMPAIGMGVAGDLLPVGSTAATAATAARRIGAREVDEAPVGAY